MQTLVFTRASWWRENFYKTLNNISLKKIRNKKEKFFKNYWKLKTLVMPIAQTKEKHPNKVQNQRKLPRKLKIQDLIEHRDHIHRHRSPAWSSSNDNYFNVE